MCAQHGAEGTRVRGLGEGVTPASAGRSQGSCPLASSPGPSTPWRSPPGSSDEHLGVGVGRRLCPRVLLPSWTEARALALAYPELS